MSAAKVVAAALAQNTERVVEMLLPNARIVCGMMRVGSVEGEPGQSLAITLKGPRAGRWVDYENDDEHGDLLDLWAASRRMSMAEAIADAAAWLGMSRSNGAPMPKQTAQAPAKVRAEANDAREANRDRARAIWLQSVPLEGTLGA